jgi:hypothetical protein
MDYRDLLSPETRVYLTAYEAELLAEARAFQRTGGAWEHIGSLCHAAINYGSHYASAWKAEHGDACELEVWTDREWTRAAEETAAWLR